MPTTTTYPNCECCASSSSSSSDGGHVCCCPNAIPSTLYATIQAPASCPLNGEVITINFIGDCRWDGSKTSACGAVINCQLVCEEGQSFSIEFTCETIAGGGGFVGLECDPFMIDSGEFTSSLNSDCCDAECGNPAVFRIIITE